MRVVPVVLLLVALALAGCSSEGKRDDDGDGLIGSRETRAWTVTVDFMDRRESYPVTSDPNLQDTDGDGLADYYEYILGGDPRKEDTDEDGLTDCQEVFHTNLTECRDPGFLGPWDGGTRTLVNNADSDAGLGRYARSRAFSDPTGTLPEGLPKSGDGISDGEEWLGYDIVLPSGAVQFTRTDPLRLDSDGDFLDDGEERFQFQSNPTNVDTDGDTCVDGQDPVPRAQELFSPGLLEVTWTEPGQSGSIDIRWIVNLADTVLEGAGGLPPTTSQYGQATQVSSDQPFVRPGFCTYSARDPWIPVTVLAERETGQGTLRPLDFRSDNPDQATRIWWSPEAGLLRWNPQMGPDLPLPVTFSGVDGSVTFEPRMRLQGS